MAIILSTPGMATTLTCRSGNTYKANGSGFIINPNGNDIGDLLNAGCTVWQQVPRIITTGTTDTSQATDSMITWNSSTSSAKAQTLGFAAPITIKDGAGDAATNNITVTPPNGWTIDGSATFVINVNLASVSLVPDTVSNFAVI